MSGSIKICPNCDATYDKNYKGTMGDPEIPESRQAGMWQCSECGEALVTNTKLSNQVEDSLKVKYVDLMIQLSANFPGIYFEMEIPHLICTYNNRTARLNVHNLKWEIDDIEEFFKS